MPGPRRPALLLLCAVAALALTACSEQTEYTVGPGRSPCWNGEAYALCMPVQRSGEATWTQMTTHEIRGFTPGWGKTWRLRVAVKHLDDPPADASSIEYTLIKTLDEQPAPGGTTFDAQLDATALWDDHPTFQLKDGAGRLGDKPFTCATPDTCTKLRQLIDARTRDIQLKLKYAEDVTQPLILTAVEARS